MKRFSFGSAERPLRVAIVGAGPSGFYTAESLLKRAGISVQVDMLDRLPTPFGLVRGGVAPDHQKIKAVTNIYTRVAEMSGFRFFGNVMLGRDIGLEDLKKHYDQIVYAVGNESDQKMGIPGEELTGSYPATKFVGWYNGHPEHKGHVFDLSVERVAVVGVGNVAMDVTRILSKRPDELENSDISHYALEALRESRVREILILGRRGFAQASFTTKEIKEIAELRGVDLVIDPSEVVLDQLSKRALSDANCCRNVEFLTDQSKLGEGVERRKVKLRFLVSPVEILGRNGRVEAVRIEKNELYWDDLGTPKPKGKNEYETLKVGMVLRSVGYRGIPIPGVPFDPNFGRIPNKAGRVTDEGDNRIEGQYVVGWAKRGPTGLIGTNRRDSVTTVDAMLEDLEGKTGKILPKGEEEGLPGILRKRGVQFVDFEDWKRLNGFEIERGRKKGKIREKFTTIAEMYKALDQ